MILNPVVNVACQAFLRAMLKESVMRYPNRGAHEHTVPAWESLSVRDRQSLQRALAAALNAAKAAERAQGVVS